MCNCLKGGKTNKDLLFAPSSKPWAQEHLCTLRGPDRRRGRGQGAHSQAEQRCATPPGELKGGRGHPRDWPVGYPSCPGWEHKAAHGTGSFWVGPELPLLKSPPLIIYIWVTEAGSQFGISVDSAESY